MQDLASKTKKGLKWSAIERILTQGIQLAITLLLARILGPTAFGLVGMLAVFIAISNVFVDSGFTSALIRKTDRNSNDLTTAFYYNVLVSIVSYLVLYISSPYIAKFYQQVELTELLRVLGLTVIINSFLLIPRVVLTAAMNFKTQAKIAIVSVVLGGGVAIILAVSDYGVWALVAQTLTSSICSVILFYIFSPWKLTGKFTREALNYLFGFGSKLLVAGILDVIYNNLAQIIIGKKFTPIEVGQYSQANQLAVVPASTMTGIIQRVTYPLYSQMQDDNSKIENAYRLTIKVAALIIFPLIVGLGLIATPLLTLLLGQEWIPAATLLSILCMGHMLYPVHAINLNLLQVKGRTDLYLKLEFVKKSIGVGILFVTIPYGVLTMCIGFAIGSYLSLFFNTYYTAKLTNITQLQQIKDLLPIWLAVLISAFIGYYLVGLYKFSPLISIPVSLFVALACYFIYLLIFQWSLIRQLRSLLNR